MNARLALSPAPATLPARVALLGLGSVGSAVWSRLAGWRGTPFGERLVLVHAANSRVAISNAHGMPMDARDLPLRHARQASTLDAVETALGGGLPRIVIDATASDVVAARHAGWLAAGIHVVTACKLGQGSNFARWQAIQSACEQGGTRYGDSATVGAGLPLLRSLRGLQAGGDRIHAIAGVLSGSMAWLCHAYDGLRPFSGFVRQARAAGYTEPDPREDLSGEDVRRKLLILARSTGVALEVGDVEVESLVPPALQSLPTAAVEAALPTLDPLMRARYAVAWKRGERLHFIARLEHGRARVGLESLAPAHPLAGGAGTDNRVAIWSDRYREQPLLIQGPGAGAGITAAAMLDDALAIQARAD